MYEDKFPHKRYKKTIDFLKDVITENSEILDLGVENPFTEIMIKNGFEVKNTKGEDLDIDFSSVKQSKAEAVTAFEIF